MTTMTTLTAVSPATQPRRNAGPLERPRGVSSITRIATIGIGLNPTPTANGRTCPIACPIGEHRRRDAR